MTDKRYELLTEICNRFTKARLKLVNEKLDNWTVEDFEQIVNEFKTSIFNEAGFTPEELAYHNYADPNIGNLIGVYILPDIKKVNPRNIGKRSETALKRYKEHLDKKLQKISDYLEKEVGREPVKPQIKKMSVYKHVGLLLTNEDKTSFVIRLNKNEKGELPYFKFKPSELFADTSIAGDQAKNHIKEIINVENSSNCRVRPLDKEHSCKVLSYYDSDTHTLNILFLCAFEVSGDKTLDAPYRWTSREDVIKNAKFYTKDTIENMMSFLSEMGAV